MQREIYKVDAYIVDANGTYNALTGYPKIFDSHNYDDDTDKAFKRAEGEWHDCCGALCKRDDRQLQVAMMIRVSDGLTMFANKYGAIAEV